MARKRLIDKARELAELAKRELGKPPYDYTELVKLIVRNRKIHLTTAYQEVRSFIYAGFLEPDEETEGYRFSEEVLSE